MGYPTGSSERKGRQGLFLGLVIMFLFILLRFLIYGLIPEKSPWHWWVRDTLMDVPRILCFGLALKAGLLLWSRRQLGFHFDRARIGLGVGLTSAALLMLYNLFRTIPSEYPVPAFIVLCASSIIVALFEETLFRSLLFNALADWKGIQKAIWGTSVLFTVFHIQAQPIAEWPILFLDGLLCAVLRSRGIGLTWLILTHAFADSIIFLGSAGQCRVLWWPPFVFVLNLLLVVAVYRWALKESEPPAPAPGRCV